MRLPPRATGGQAPRGRGRPRVLERGAAVSTWLKPADHDALIVLARRSDRSVSATLRDLVRAAPGKA